MNLPESRGRLRRLRSLESLAHCMGACSQAGSSRRRRGIPASASPSQTSPFIKPPSTWHTHPNKDTPTHTPATTPTHTLTHSHTHTLTHSHTHTLTHSHTYTLTHSHG